jgi:hypothetical protein
MRKATVPQIDPIDLRAHAAPKRDDFSTTRADLHRELEHLAQLRDHARVEVALAKMEVRARWDHDVEPRIFELEQRAKAAARELGTSARALAEEIRSLLAASK